MTILSDAQTVVEPGPTVALVKSLLQVESLLNEDDRLNVLMRLVRGVGAIHSFHTNIF